MTRDATPRLFLDLDGVFADFRGGAIALCGIDPDAAGGPSRGVLWARIAKAPGFWESLAELPGSRNLLEAVRPLAPFVLTGVAGRARDCEAQKQAWCAVRLGIPPERVFVVRAQDKPFYCRPGDVLLDDRAKNVAAWDAAGGIGVLHDPARPEASVAALERLGVLAGPQDPRWRAAADERRKRVASRGASAWIWTAAVRKEIAAAFPAMPGAAGGKARLECQRVLRLAEAGDDLPPRANPEIEIVGELRDAGSGHHLLIVAVDGQIRRPDGGVHHIVHALDLQAADRLPAPPTAATAEALLRQRLDEVGGDPGRLADLPASRRLRFAGSYALIGEERARARDDGAR